MLNFPLFGLRIHVVNMLFLAQSSALKCAVSKLPFLYEIIWDQYYMYLKFCFLLCGNDNNVLLY